MPVSTDSAKLPASGQRGETADTSPSTMRRRSPMARFFMSGDLRAATGISRTHLDFYLREGIVEPTARTESGYLLFDDAERERLDAVIDWRQQGVSLREIRQRLGRDKQRDPTAQPGSDDT